MNPPFRARRQRLLERLKASGLTAVAVTHLPNVRYLSGFSGSNALLLVKVSGSVLYTDPRYTLQAGQECDCRVRVIRGPLWDAVPAGLQCGFEADRLSYERWRSVSRRLKLKPVKDLVETLRTVKDDEEIAKIRAAVELGSKAYEAAIARFQLGCSEMDLAADIDHTMRKLGAEGPSFETIVAAGPRSALPHAHPTGYLPKTNQLLLVDMGASLDGYASDMTRVVHLGSPGRKAKNLYRAVLEAQLASIDAIRPGVPASAVDAAARRVLRGYKLDKAFQHSTGHGLGLEIHEAPRLGKKDDTPLEAGMAITVEPGAYLEGFGGVRIEDTVLVTKTGVEVLTPTPKELLVL